VTPRRYACGSIRPSGEHPIFSQDVACPPSGIPSARPASRVRFGPKGLRVQLRIDAKDSKGNGWRSTANLRLK
jgi:hypothetical protein